MEGSLAKIYAFEKFSLGFCCHGQDVQNVVSLWGAKTHLRLLDVDGDRLSLHQTIQNWKCGQCPT